MILQNVGDSLPLSVLQRGGRPSALRSERPHRPLGHESQSLPALSEVEGSVAAPRVPRGDPELIEWAEGLETEGESGIKGGILN